jgi:hypothetical protein
MSLNLLQLFLPLKLVAAIGAVFEPAAAIGVVFESAAAVFVAFESAATVVCCL